MKRKRAVSVAIENSAYSFDMEYDYLLREDMPDVRPGCRVLVPFGNGNRVRQAIVTVSPSEPDTSKRLKYVSKVIDDEPVLNAEMLKLMYLLKERTFCTLFEAAKTLLPAGMCRKTVVAYTCVPGASLDGCSAQEVQIYDYLSEKSGYVVSDKLLGGLGFDPGSDLPETMVGKGLLLRNYDSVRRTGDLTVKTVRLTQAGEESLTTCEKLTKKQREIIEVLADVGTASVKELCYFTGYTPAVIRALGNKGYVEIFDNEVYRYPDEPAGTQINREEIILNPAQQKAYDDMLGKFSEGRGGVSLLYGVTGSGKTQVYLKLIDSMLSAGRTVIVMVPEISLTPQTLSIFRARYGRDIAVFHSALSSGQRTDEWKRVRRGEVKIVIGTRSAVFAPLENLGLIIIDEEQEHTYKSEKSPRYNAKNAARFRCAENRALLVLASATPSIESYANALSGRYSLEVLPERYSESKLPDVEIIDMCTDALSGSVFFSKRLYELLEENLEKGRQSILLINRRGYNTFAQCRSCGHVITCPSCSISMTYHHANGRLMCHYCGYSEPFTSKCPECGSSDVRYSGFGTQKIEDELAELLPGARVLRMDADSTMTRASHEKKLSAFANREYDILLGTQMVAKGLDFENVTLVGVISADMQLNNDDFRSQERTFDLLTQVVGRAGRGRYSGVAVIQTINPENEVIRIASEQDYRAFYDMEIKLRRMLIYPPYCDMCLVGFSGLNETGVQAASKKFFGMLKAKLLTEYSTQKIIVLGPMPARISKISNKFRYRLILKCRNSPEFRRMMGELLKEFAAVSAFSEVSVYIDIDPENIL
ncbi:MAG: primosomal protein N' [Clostridia bacterium]|nr:primosomal protein N' [Clostridia bacterium]